MITIISVNLPRCRGTNCRRRQIVAAAQIDVGNNLADTLDILYGYVWQRVVQSVIPLKIRACNVTIKAMTKASIVTRLNEPNTL